MDESQKEDNLEGLRVAKQNGNLLISIIEDILDLSKIEAGQLDIARWPFSIDTVIETKHANSTCLPDPEEEGSRTLAQRSVAPPCTIYLWRRVPSAADFE